MAHILFHDLSKHHRKPVRALLLFSSIIFSSWAAIAQVDDTSTTQRLHPSQVEHVTQAELNEMLATDPLAAFLFAFDLGDEMFEVDFTAVDGGGANVGNGERTTRIPRADLNGQGEWANHFPERATGPNGSSCISCHLQPVADGAGGTSSDVHRDPLHSGRINQMIHRNTPHLHGMGMIQRVAEEMTEDLHALRDKAIAQAQASAGAVTVSLESKGISFGQISIRPSRDGGRTRQRERSKKTTGRMSRPKRHQDSTGSEFSDVRIDYGQLEGIDEDLVVKPFQWKGTFPSVRAFNLDAMHNELGVQPREMLPDGVDGDYDGVVNEATIGDMTAMSIYLAAQPRPTTNVELGEYGLGPNVPAEDIAQINAGEVVFGQIGCASCHTPELTINDPVFSEPSTSIHFRDASFPGGQDPVALGLDPNNPMTFDLTADVPDNMVFDASGQLVRHLGALEKNETGGGILRAFGDMKRHDMGSELAESIDEAGTGASVFLTENLWGVGVTAPYLHDGRATTLTEAILWHGGEAADSRLAFESISPDDQAALIAFLQNMVIFLPGE